MVSAAGILFLTAAKETLFLKRGEGGDYPGFWCFPGGTTEDNETAEDTAARETVEEIGFLPAGDRVELTRSTGSPPLAVEGAPPVVEPVEYTTFLQRIAERFDPQVNGEHTGFAWARPDAPPEPLHPGCRIGLARLTMDELGIARAMAAGDLSSPQRYHNVWLFDIRITGTGYAFRNRGRREHVWRDPKHYLNGEFLARCNGLTVVWTHPEESMLSSKEFDDKAIGSIMLPYIKGDDVWGIAKIYDAGAAEDMALQDLSTSPGVILGSDDDTRVRMEDGLILLIEGKPRLIDHIAICPLGVWDKGGDPSGVRTDSIRNDAMADETAEEKERREKEEKDRKDAANINMKLADAVEGLAKRLDAMEQDRKDEKEREDARRKDASRADAKARMDAERRDWEREDAAHCAADDAQEAAECDTMVKDGMDPAEAMDKARKDRRDRVDARRKDAAAEEEKRIAEKERNDAVRADSVESIKKLVEAELARRQLPESERAALASEQARADAVHTAFGTQAPRPMDGETSADYQIRQGRFFQKHSKRWKDTNIGVLDAATRAVVVSDIYADAVAASRSDDLLPAGQLVQRTYTNPSGHVITEFRGRDSIFKTFSAPTQAVLRFNTEKRA